MKKYIVKVDNKLNHAIKKMNRLGLKILLCVDVNDKLIGTLSDGDIRRYLEDNSDLNVKINLLCNKNPTYFFQNQKINKKIDFKYNIIPIVDKKKKILSIINLKDSYELPNENTRVNIIGLGYAGLTLSCILAEYKFTVYGYEKNNRIKKLLINKLPTFYEPGLKNYLKKNIGKYLFITNNLIEANIHIITVGTPINKSKKPILNSIKESALDISKVISKGDLVIVRSTVPVGTTRNIIKKNIEKYSNLECGTEFSLVFAPERTAEGIALKELKKNPQIIGSFDKNSFDIANKFFNTFCDVTIDAGSLEAAEVCKLIDNSYRDYNFAFSNNLSFLADKLNLDSNQLIKLVNLGYSRNNIPIPSPGVGGPCLSKDSYIFAEIFQKLNLNNNFLINTRITNEYGPTHIYKKLKKYFNSSGEDINKQKIVVIGIAFKGDPATSDTRNSSSLDILEKFNKKQVFIYDPVASKEELKELDYKVLKNVSSCFKNKNAVIIMNNHESYKQWDLKILLKGAPKNFLFFDGWRMFDEENINNFKNVNYMSIDIN